MLFASFTYADISVLAAIDELKRDLKQRNIKLILAGRRTELTRWFRINRLKSHDDDLVLVPDLYLALKLIQSKRRVAEKQEHESETGLEPEIG